MQFKGKQSPRNATIVFKSGFSLLSMAEARAAFLFALAVSQLEKLARKLRTYFVDTFLSSSNLAT